MSARKVCTQSLHGGPNSPTQRQTVVVALRRAAIPADAYCRGDPDRDRRGGRLRWSRAVTGSGRAGSSLVMTLVEDRDRWSALVAAAQRGDASAWPALIDRFEDIAV